MKTFFVCLVVVAAAMAAEQRDKRGLLAPAIAPWGVPLAASGILAPRVAIGAPAIAAPGILASGLALGAPAIAAPAIAAPLNAPLLSRTIVSPWAGHAPLVW